MNRMASSVNDAQDELMGDYREAYQRSMRDPAGFWRDAAGAIDWIRAPDRILDDSEAPIYRWFPDGELNTCFNALDRHVEAGRGQQPALIHGSSGARCAASPTDATSRCPRRSRTRPCSTRCGPCSATRQLEQR
jgi:hypothetical protein